MYSAQFSDSSTSPITSDKLDAIDALIPADFVIARDGDGHVLSRFSDSVWKIAGEWSGRDLTFALKNVNFTTNPELYATITQQMRVLMWFWIFSEELDRNDIKRSGIQKARLAPLISVASVCYSVGVDLFSCAKSAEFQARLKSALLSLGFYTTKVRASSVNRALQEFNSIAALEDAKRLGVGHIWTESRDKDMSIIMSRALALSSNSKPTKLIPTRILGEFIGGSLKLANSGFVSDIHALARTLLASHNEGGGSWETLRKMPEVYANYLQNELLRYVPSKKSQLFNAFKKLIQDLRVVCGYMVLAFTGTRISEVIIAPFDCLETINIPTFGDCTFFTTRTRKILQENYSVPMQWVTTAEIRPFIALTQSLSIIEAYLKGYPIIPDKMPLFVAPGYSARKGKNEHYDYPICGDRLVIYENGMIHRWFPNCRITEDDIKELFEFDFLSYTGDNSIAAGGFWPFSTHQFRRSLAVYASRTGMVSLPSLGAQFKHISELMTAMYSRNSSYAKSFIPLQNTGLPLMDFMVVGEFREGQYERTAVQIEEQIIKYQGRLGGARGAAIQRAKDKGEMPVQFRDRESTEKALKDKRNPLHYESTPIGGCLRASGMCGSYGIEVVVPCAFGCADAVVHDEKLESYLDGIEAGLEHMDPNSMPAKETRRLLDLIKVTEVE